MKYDKINIIGGGSNAAYLNELTAKYTGVGVHAGPGEATAIGNILSQMLEEGTFADLKEARIKRRLTMALVEERAGITHVTLTKVEKGDAGVSIGIYTKVMFVLGLIDNVYNLAEPDNDVVGKMYNKENLPKRVYYTREEKK